MEPHAETLLRKSADDRAVLDHALAPAILGFHAQQACEKLLKALLTERGCEYPRTHDLAVLEQLLERHDGPLPALAVSLPLLTDYAVPYRYDDLPPGFQVDAVELRKTVDGLRAHVEGRLQALLTARQQQPVQDAGPKPKRPGRDRLR
jgi:HEPN domain-containing protein